MCIYTYYISIELYILYIFIYIYIWYTYYIYIYVSKLCGHIFDVEPTVIDALLGSNELSSMHFWVSVELYRCSFGFKLMFIDVVFISFSNLSMHLLLNTFDWNLHRCRLRYLLPIGLSSMHPGPQANPSTCHRCIWRLAIRWWTGCLGWC